MKPDILVPLALVGSPALLMAYALRLRAQTRHQALEIIREALERGLPLDRATVEAIAAGYRPAGVDLRRGAILLAVAAATALLSRTVHDEATQFVLGLAAFPGLVGGTYIGFHLGRARTIRGPGRDDD